MAAFRRFPLSKVPGYILAQIVGCFLGTLIIFVSPGGGQDNLSVLCPDG